MASARQALYETRRPCYLVPKRADVAAIGKLRLAEPTLACFAEPLSGRPTAAQEFVATLKDHLQKELASKKEFRLVGAEEPADAELLVEVDKLHNGLPPRSLLRTVLLSFVFVPPRFDPGVAGANVFLLRPGTHEWLAAYGGTFVANPNARDRFPRLARGLARSLAECTAELKRASQARGAGKDGP